MNFYFVYAFIRTNAKIMDFSENILAYDIVMGICCQLYKNVGIMFLRIKVITILLFKINEAKIRKCCRKMLLG